MTNSDGLYSWDTCKGLWWCFSSVCHVIYVEDHPWSCIVLFKGSFKDPRYCSLVLFKCTQKAEVLEGFRPCTGDSKVIGMFMNECIDSTIGRIHVCLLCCLPVTIRGLVGPFVSHHDLLPPYTHLFMYHLSKCQVVHDHSVSMFEIHTKTCVFILCHARIVLSLKCLLYRRNQVIEGRSLHSEKVSVLWKTSRFRRWFPGRGEWRWSIFWCQIHITTLVLWKHTNALWFNFRRERKNILVSIFIKFWL
jgi:hypothetical protein